MNDPVLCVQSAGARTRHPLQHDAALLARAGATALHERGFRGLLVSPLTIRLT